MKRKIAVSVPTELVDETEAAVDAGHAASVSAFVTQAISEKLRHDRLAEVLDEMDLELGRPTRRDESWAKSALGL